MNLRVALSSLFLSCVMVSASPGDSWGPIRQKEFYSQNWKHMLEIGPHSNWPRNPGHCAATLYSVEGENRTKLWFRFLVNNHAPVRVFVSDSGEYVLTMDEWHSVGELPVVIYGKRGELIRVHSTDSLGLKEDGSHIKATITSYWWNEDSMSFFGPDERTFLTRLHWGKLLILNLDNGDVMNAEWYERFKGWGIREERWKALHDYAAREIRERALRWLDSRDSKERKIGVTICGCEKIEMAIPRLKELLADTEYFTTNVPKDWTRVYYVRKAAQEALRCMGQECDGVLVEESDPQDSSN